MTMIEKQYAETTIYVDDKIHGECEITVVWAYHLEWDGNGIDEPREAIIKPIKEEPQVMVSFVDSSGYRILVDTDNYHEASYDLANDIAKRAEGEIENAILNHDYPV